MNLQRCSQTLPPNVYTDRSRFDGPSRISDGLSPRISLAAITQVVISPLHFHRLPAGVTRELLVVTARGPSGGDPGSRGGGAARGGEPGPRSGEPGPRSGERESRAKFRGKDQLTRTFPFLLGSDGIQRLPLALSFCLESLYAFPENALDNHRSFLGPRAIVSRRIHRPYRCIRFIANREPSMFPRSKYDDSRHDGIYWSDR